MWDLESLITSLQMRLLQASANSIASIKVTRAKGGRSSRSVLHSSSVSILEAYMVREPLNGPSSASAPVSPYSPGSCWLEMPGNPSRTEPTKMRGGSSWLGTGLSLVPIQSSLAASTLDWRPGLNLSLRNSSNSSSAHKNARRGVSPSEIGLLAFSLGSTKRSASTKRMVLLPEAFGPINRLTRSLNLSWIGSVNGGIPPRLILTRCISTT